MKPKNRMAIRKKITICVWIFFASIFLSGNAPSIFATEKCEKTQAEAASTTIDWPASPLSQKILSGATSIPELIQYFFEWGVGLGGLGVFIALIIAGVQYITSIADPGKLNNARDRIKSSLIGLVLLLSSWAIFNLINPSLNTLKDLDVSSLDTIQNGGIATAIPCNNNWDCCKISGCDQTACPANNPNCCIDLNCSPELFVCCQKNDTDCIKGKNEDVAAGNANKLPSNASSTCARDSQCESNNCFCDRSTKPKWTQYCKENPQVCIHVIGEPKLGCDIIAFYTAPDMQSGTEVWYPKPPNELYPDSGWVNIKNDSGQTITIKSYQAFKYARNRQNELLDNTGKVVTDANLAAKIPCGRSSCGCKINICYDVNPALSSCANPEGEALAFNQNLDGSHTVIKIIDESKGFYASAKKTGSWIYDNAIGWVKNLLK